MANFHVVPKGDAIQHVTRNDKCPCAVEIRTVTADDASHPGTFDVWYYHRTVSLNEAVLHAGKAEPEPVA